MRDPELASAAAQIQQYWHLAAGHPLSPAR
jgi:hypothetical protein